MFDGVRLDREDGKWRLYRRQEDVHIATQPSFSLLVTSELARFLQIVQDTNTMYYDHRAQTVSARDILTQYKRYQTWRDELPQALMGVEGNAPLLPHVFYLQ